MGGGHRRPLSFDDGQVQLDPTYEGAERGGGISDILNQAITEKIRTERSSHPSNGTFGQTVIEVWLHNSG